MIVNEIAVPANAAHATDEIPEPPPALGRVRECLEIARRDDRRIERCSCAHADPLAIEIRARTFLGPRELAVRGRARDAEHEPAGTHQRDLRGKERTVADE